MLNKELVFKVLNNWNMILSNLNFRDRYKENVKELDKITSGLIHLSHSNNLFNEIFNTNV